MVKKLFGYSDFISESKLEIILESIMTYSKEFIEILGKINSPISKEIMELSGDDVDVNTNYINVNLTKDDTIFFNVDSKMKDVKYKLASNAYLYTTFISELAKVEKYGVTDENYYALSSPPYGTTSQEYSIEKHLSKEEVLDFWNGLFYDDEFSFFDKLYRSGDHLCIIEIPKEHYGSYKAITNYKYLTPIERPVSSEMKVGRFVRALLKKSKFEFSDKDIENFVNGYKSQILQLNDVFRKFEIVSGDDIKKYYHQNRYESSSGSMGNSCMQYPSCQDYFEIYTKNPEVCSLVILRSDNDDKIKGRAILWVDSENRKIMDRIYTNDSSNEQLFIDYAISNGFYYKKRQNMSSDEPFVKNSDDKGIDEIKINLNPDNSYQYYPYMDSMKYYYQHPDNLRNYISIKLEYNTLEDTDGGFSNNCDCCDGGGTINCYDCDGEGSVDCDTCDGEGSVTCDKCDGEGSVTCGDCKDGVDSDGNKCTTCGGDGSVSCSDCDGEGREDCSDCDGDGSQGCGRCGGDGYVDCYECNY